MGAPHEGDPLAQLRHDLRTPLNQIIGYSEMLLEDSEAASEQAGDLQRILLAARTMLESVTKLQRLGLG